ncbi:class I SAM-dependent methyltransferase [Roseibacterium sp. SDUM158016]|uniref:class I SAM-dependent methyltransferase n=1 Tax=Roseicyclus sediminis TaxID=2980997 RepID=UPI0021CEDF02|nr:class I SAM-dependent methyltransferase [Roseibacterium sp. SDUM158016]MCU4654433.1 class I SAM-dependent methyltransferase [Roseibacterium sp. SDUM158016]
MAGPSETGVDARRSAPAAQRNREAIAREVLKLAPERGRALEIASGSGEHIVRFAALMPGLDWHPTDPDPGQRASIAAWTEAEGLTNIAPPRPVDVSNPGWAEQEPPTDLVVLVNLLHLVTDAAAWSAIDGIAAALAPGGTAVIYGPFLRDGETTSEGDAAFHRSLRERDPRIGYKDVIDVVARAVAAGLCHVETVRMPANNLLLAFAKD